LVEIEDLYTDVLVVGTGAGGCATALAAARAGLDVTLLTKTADPAESSTAEAQGGTIGPAPGDSVQLLMSDIMAAGNGLCEPSAVRLLATEGPPFVQKFLIDELQVPFARNPDGSLDFTQEAAHSIRRIVYCHDATGRAIYQGLIEAVRREPKISLSRSLTAVDLITIPHHSTNRLDLYAEPECLGAYLLDNGTRRVKRIFARSTVLATGGVGQVYLHTTNPSVARGDGIAMAARAGAAALNMEYVQFHPTAFYHRDAGRFLISETVRGEGARLLTRSGEPFMRRYHPQGDLAPRDVVTRAIHEELLRRGEEYVLLDPSGLKVDARERFPTIYATCLKYGVDITRGPIPVVPAAHYLCGGVKVDEWGRTSLRRLFAVGEVSCTGLHGANRLASTSLLEALLWGTRAGQYMARTARDLPSPSFDHVAEWRDEGLTEETDPALVIQDWNTLKSTMWNYAGIVRTKKRLDRAWADLEYLDHRVEQFYRETKLSDDLVGLRNALKVAILITDAARRNPESRGCHFRLD
jgi:L-aspartate oxidase